MDIVAGILGLECEGELGVGGDDGNLPEILDDLGSVVLPIAEDGYREIRAVPSVRIVQHLGLMHIWLIPGTTRLKVTTVQKTASECLLACGRLPAKLEALYDTSTTPLL